MINLTHAENQIKCVANFQELVNTDYKGVVNALCWNRFLQGDFDEIISKFDSTENITEITQKDLLALQLSEQGKLAREFLLNDFKLLDEHGASPSLNIIKYYEKDDSTPFFPTDVYSFHVDKAPIAADTFLCTYSGAPSEIIANNQVEQKILIPEIRKELQKLHHDSEEDFDTFLCENFFDLHYQAKPNAKTTNLGVGHLWRINTRNPESKVAPCVHRAPIEKDGEFRLLLIC